MITIKVDVKGLDAAIKRMEKGRDKLDDLKEPLDTIKTKQTRRWAQNFTSEGGIYDKWAPLSPEWTIPERKAQGYGAGPILIRQGTLLAHFVEQNEAGEVTNDAINWTMTNKGGDRGYAASTVSMHTGYTTALNTVVPARKLWDLDETDQRNAEKELEKYVERVIKRYF